MALYERTRGREQDPFDKMAGESLFQRISRAYLAELAAGVDQRELRAKYGCTDELWFNKQFAPPYNFVTPEARDTLNRVYQFASSTQLIVRLERGHPEQQMPIQGERLSIIPHGSGYPLEVQVESIQMPPRRDPKTAILNIKRL